MRGRVGVGGGSAGHEQRRGSVHEGMGTMLEAGLPHARLEDALPEPVVVQGACGARGAVRGAVGEVRVLRAHQHGRGRGHDVHVRGAGGSAGAGDAAVRPVQVHEGAVELGEVGGVHAVEAAVGRGVRPVHGPPARHHGEGVRLDEHVDAGGAEVHAVGDAEEGDERERVPRAEPDDGDGGERAAEHGGRRVRHARVVRSEAREHGRARRRRVVRRRGDPGRGEGAVHGQRGVRAEDRGVGPGGRGGDVRAGAPRRGGQAVPDGDRRAAGDLRAAGGAPRPEGPGCAEGRGAGGDVHGVAADRVGGDAEVQPGCAVRDPGHLGPRVAEAGRAEGGAAAAPRHGRAGGGEADGPDVPVVVGGQGGGAGDGDVRRDDDGEAVPAELREGDGRARDGGVQRPDGGRGHGRAGPGAGAVGRGRGEQAVVAERAADGGGAGREAGGAAPGDGLRGRVCGEQEPGERGGADGLLGGGDGGRHGAEGVRGADVEGHGPGREAAVVQEDVDEDVGGGRQVPQGVGRVPGAVGRPGEGGRPGGDGDAVHGHRHGGDCAVLVLPAPRGDRQVHLRVGGDAVPGLGAAPGGVGARADDGEEQVHVHVRGRGAARRTGDGDGQAEQDHDAVVLVGVRHLRVGTADAVAAVRHPAHGVRRHQPAEAARRRGRGCGGQRADRRGVRPESAGSCRPFFFFPLQKVI
eukprot:Rhum_TRINITY_DN15459_c2_g1::Rhum_TRINITY_DN15459_c2_g1_i2::g.160236::m.160236